MSHVIEAWEAESFDLNLFDKDKSSASKNYIVYDAENEVEAIEAVRLEAPETYNGIPASSISLSERLTETLWKVEVSYSYNDDANVSGRSSGDDTPDEDVDSYTFEISAGTKRVIWPVKHKKTYPATAPAPTAGINDGEGADIIMPIAKFSETHALSAVQCNTKYRKDLASMVGKINTKSFKGYDPGQVLFYGASGGRTGLENWTVNFEFMTQEKQENITIGDITGINKDPWDLIWCQYKEEESADKTRIVKKVKAVHVEQVYEEEDFGKLGI